MLVLNYPAYDVLETAQFPRPETAPGEIVVQVSACGICGSELETFARRSPRRTPPLLMGHEFCGVVASTSGNSGGPSVGDRVVVNAIVPCGACRSCQMGNTHLCPRRQVFGMHRPGAFAEYVSVPEICVLPWPEDVPAASACLAEPLANGVHVAELLRGVPAHDVVVIGAGSIGLCVLQALTRLVEARVIVSDLRYERLEYARALGAFRTVVDTGGALHTVVRELTDDEGVDVAVDAVGTAATKRMSLSLVRPGGTVVWIGLHDDEVPIPTYDVTLRERRILGTYGATMQDLAASIRMMQRSEVDMSSWVTVAPLSDGVAAFRRQLDPDSGVVKTVLRPAP